jgi:hypothetical protein
VIAAVVLYIIVSGALGFHLGGEHSPGDREGGAGFSTEVYRLSSNHDRLLLEGPFELPAVGAPPRAVEVVHHNLEHDDVVPLRLPPSCHSPSAGAREKAVSLPYVGVSSSRT